MKSLSDYIIEASTEVTFKSLYNSFKKSIWTVSAKDLKDIFGEEKLIPQEIGKISSKYREHINKPIKSIGVEGYVDNRRVNAIFLRVEGAYGGFVSDIYLLDDKDLEKVFTQEELQKLHTFIKQHWKQVRKANN